MPCSIGVLPLGWPPVAVALAAGPVEDRLARRFQGVQGGIGIGQRARAGGHRVGQGLTLGEENCVVLEGCQVVQESRRRVERDPGMTAQRGERLVLQRVDAAVELVATALVRAAGETGSTPSGPVILTLRTEGTERQTSATVSLVGRADAGHTTAEPQSSSFTFAGSGIVTRTRPFCVRLVSRVRPRR